MHRIHVEQIAAGPAGVIGVEQVRTATRRDPVLSRLLEFTKNGWPSQCPSSDLQPYWIHREELTTEDGVLLWGLRVVVPLTLRNEVLDLLHEAHPGSTRCKQLARSYVWWPGIDRDVENKVQSCSCCIEERRDPNAPSMGRWEFANRPWKRLHIDHAGPFLGKYWFLWIDSHSKFAGVHRVASNDSANVIKNLRDFFAYFGLPDQIVSDNGPAFVSDEFQQFLRNNGIQYMRSSPYHPQTNGEAERFVQTFKKATKAGDQSVTEEELDLRLQRFLLTYRVTPHGVTGRAPAEALMTRRPVMVLDRLRPDLRRDSARREEVSNQRRVNTVRDPDYDVNDRVFVRFYYNKRRWRPGVIVNVAGPLSYDVQVGGELHRGHASQLIHNRELPVSTAEDDVDRTVLEQAFNEQSPATETTASVLTNKEPARAPTQDPSPEPVQAPKQSTPVKPQEATLGTDVKVATPQSPPPKLYPSRLPAPTREPSTRVKSKLKRFDDEFSKMGSSKMKSSK